MRMEMKMRTVITVIGVLLVIGSTAQATAASESRVQRGHATATEQFRKTYNYIDSRARPFCSQEAGNPYNERTDYSGWSAWRLLGASDSRNDCP